MVLPANMSTEAAPSEQRLGWHWVWFLPLWVMVLSLVERHTVAYGFAILKLGYERWSWAIFFSPSAYFCLKVLAASISLPVLGLALVALVVKNPADSNLNARQRWLYSVLLIIGIFLLPFISEVLMWGSFPFTFDNQGVSRLRNDSLHSVAQCRLWPILTGGLVVTAAKRCFLPRRSCVPVRQT